MKKTILFGFLLFAGFGTSFIFQQFNSAIAQISAFSNTQMQEPDYKETQARFVPLTEEEIQLASVKNEDVARMPSSQGDAERSPIEGSKVTPEPQPEIQPIHSEAKPEVKKVIKANVTLEVQRTGKVDSEAIHVFEVETGVRIPVKIAVTNASPLDYAHLYIESMNASCLYTAESEESLVLSGCSSDYVSPAVAARVIGSVGLIIHSEHLPDQQAVVGKVVLPVEIDATEDYEGKD